MKLMIVESPAKAKTVGKYLGRDWRVIASVGHVRDLVPENGSIDVGKGFAPTWQIMPGKEKIIKQIEGEVKKADEIYLASDPDREGEAIAWHILSILTEKKGLLAGKRVYRATFHEITRNAILRELEKPREIDQNLVDAYLVRRALDYLIGFTLSPVLWRKSIGKSAGRVQSVAVFLVVEREKEIEAFKSEEYWSIDADCRKGNHGFVARLSRFGGEKIEKMSIRDKTGADRILDGLRKIKTLSVAGVEKKQTQRKPYAPFTTSTLQQEAARKLRFGSKRTMGVAQKLYESGLITYMRTDSTNLAADAVNDIRSLISKDWGDSYIPKTPNVYARKQKNAQEAHEAVRPTGFFSAPDIDDADAKKLYDLIWRRTLASQMTNAVFDSVAVDLESGEAAFHATGQTLVFDGFLKVYNEDRDDGANEDRESKLPPLAVGDTADIVELLPEQHFTQPPPRFTEASLVKKLEELGIGRPSTYASIMSTIVDRKYAELDKSRRFVPTTGGWLVSAFLADYFNQLIQVDFTAKTEDALDDISNGAAKKLDVLSGFWAPFEKWVDSAKDVPIKDVWDKLNKDLSRHIFRDGGNKCPECGGELAIRQGRFGAFISCRNYPECKYMKGLSSAESKEQSNLELGDGISFKTGRFGPYVTDGTKNASARKHTAETITLEIARELLSGAGKKAEPANLGKNPATGADILFYPTGRYGAYVSSNKVNVGVREQPTLSEAAELINNKKPSAFRRKRSK
ncbi:MAG: type I DNA topoisomerase [Rickettsiales bacterium]|jgi:DNA topoisomerase-1|nr:type I DNA topoisomerase [Rickettsiales bacterium]